MKMLWHEVPLVDKFFPSGSGNIIQKTVLICICEEKVCQEGEFADLTGFTGKISQYPCVGKIWVFPSIFRELGKDIPIYWEIYRN